MEFIRPSLGNELDFRNDRFFGVSVAVMFIAALLLVWYVHTRRRSDPVWMIVLSVSLALALFYNGLMRPYRSQDCSKRDFGWDIRAALRRHGYVGGIYTYKVSNLNGGLFYAGYPVRRLNSMDDFPRGKEEVYLLCPDFPQLADYSWRNLLRSNYTYNEHPLALWKGTPRRPPRVQEEPEGDAAEDINGEKK